MVGERAVSVTPGRRDQGAIGLLDALQGLETIYVALESGDDLALVIQKFLEISLMACNRILSFTDGGDEVGSDHFSIRIVRVRTKS